VNPKSKKMECQLCERVAIRNEPELCQYHDLAYKNIQSNYEKWIRAYGKLSWSEYVEMLRESSEAGDWIKECCSLFNVENIVKNKE